MFSTLSTMLIYSISALIVVTLLLGIFYFFTIGSNMHTKHFQLSDFFTCALLIFVSGIRYNVGSDYFEYLKSALSYFYVFKNIKNFLTPNIVLAYNFQIGYPLLSIFSHQIYNSRYTIMFVVAVVLYIPYTIYFRKHTVNAYYAVMTFILFGFWGMSLNILKQALAMVFMLYAFEAYKKKKYVLFLVISVFGFFFHTTAVIAAIGIVATRFIKPDKKTLRFLVIAGICLRVGWQFAIKIMLKLPFLSKYSRYFSGGEINAINNRTFLILGAALETMIVIFFLHIALDKKKQLLEVQPDIEYYLSIIMLGIPFSILGISKTLWLANRFAKYFFQFVIVLVPALLSKRKIKFINIKIKEKYLFVLNNRLLIILGLFIWNMMYSVLMLDNNSFEIRTLFNIE